MGSCTANGIASTISNRTLVNIAIDSTPNVSILASRSKACHVPIDACKRDLGFSTPNCLRHRTALHNTRRGGVRVISSIFHDRGSNRSILSRATTFSMSRRLKVHFNDSLEIVSQNDVPNLKTGVFVHKCGSIGLGTRPLVIVSKIIRGARNIRSMFKNFCVGTLTNVSIGGVRGIRILGGTASVCNSGKTGNTVLVAAGHNRAVTAGVSLGLG